MRVCMVRWLSLEEKIAMLTFQANTVSAEYDENEVLIIGFADLQADGEPNHYFMIQHSAEYDEQDVKLVMDTYYIERDGQGYILMVVFKRLALAPGKPGLN